MPKVDGDMKEGKTGRCGHVLFAIVITILMCSGAAAQDEARLVLKTEVAKEIRVKEKGETGIGIECLLNKDNE